MPKNNIKLSNSIELNWIPSIQDSRKLNRYSFTYVMQKTKRINWILNYNKKKEVRVVPRRCTPHVTTTGRPTK